MKIEIKEGLATLLFEDQISRIIQITDTLPLRFSGARIFRSTAQSIPKDTYTAISFDTVQVDTDGYFSVVNPTRLTIPRGGYYLFGGRMSYAVNNTGLREVVLARNGDGLGYGVDSRVAVTSALTKITIAFLNELNTDDYLELLAWQNSGDALDIYTGTGALWVHYLGP